MKNQLIFIVAAIIVMSFQARAQQALYGGTEIVSPKIHEDHRVTFRVQAPGAEEVKLTGDWMPAEGWAPGSVIMERDENGLWAYTTSVLEPELYGYELYWIGIGKADFFYTNVVNYKDRLDAMGMPNTYRESEGGHIWKNWRIYLSEFVPQLFRQ